MCSSRILKFILFVSIPRPQKLSPGAHFSSRSRIRIPDFLSTVAGEMIYFSRIFRSTQKYFTIRSYTFGRGRGGGRGKVGEHSDRRGRVVEEHTAKGGCSDRVLWAPRGDHKRRLLSPLDRGCYRTLTDGRQVRTTLCPTARHRAPYRAAPKLKLSNLCFTYTLIKQGHAAGYARGTTHGSGDFF